MTCTQTSAEMIEDNITMTEIPSENYFHLKLTCISATTHVQLVEHVNGSYRRSVRMAQNYFQCKLSKVSATILASCLSSIIPDTWLIDKHQQCRQGVH